MSNFATLKKSSADISRLTKEIEKLNTPADSGSREDNRFWSPEVDKSGNGYAVIRFLPAPAVDGDDALPWVRIWNHGFKGPTGKWYIENSLTTLNQKDPVSEYNSVLWNASSDDSSPQRKQAREQKRRLTYIANIYVVTDSKNPDNEGKVFLFKFGKKIFDKITDAMNPKYEDEEPLNPFDLWQGANFKLKIRNLDGYRNYDKSEFESKSALSKNDSELESIWKSEYSLKEFTDPKNFKSYDELKKKLEDVLGTTSHVNDQITDAVTTPKSIKESFDRNLAKTKKEAVSDDDDDLEYFKSLADD